MSGITSYAWSPRDELLQITPPTGLPVTSSYRYDGLRLERRRGSVVQTMVWDGQDVLSIEEADWALYPRGPEIARQVAFSSQGSLYAPHVHHPDGQGTMLAVTDAAQQTETTYVRDAWGNPISGSKAFGPFVYFGEPGYYEDPNLTLLYVRQRWLDPEVGAWLSADPVEDELRYAYARNSPTLFTDPSGTLSWRELWERVKRAWSGSTMVSTADPVQPGTVPIITNPVAPVRRVPPGPPGPRMSRRQQIEAAQAYRQQQRNRMLLQREAVTNLVRWAAEYPGDWFARTFKIDLDAYNSDFATWQQLKGFWAFAPPGGFSPAVVEYWGGFLRGVWIGLDHQINPDRITEDLVDLILELAKYPDFWSAVRGYYNETLAQFRELGAVAHLMSPFDRGKQAGIIVVGVVALLLAAITFGKSLPGALRSLATRPLVRTLLARAARSPRGAGGGRGGGVSAGVAANDPPGSTPGSSGVAASASTSGSEGPGGVQPGAAAAGDAPPPTPQGDATPPDVPPVSGAADEASKRPAASSSGANPAEQGQGQVREDLAAQSAEGVTLSSVPLPKSTVRVYRRFGGPCIAEHPSGATFRFDHRGGVMDTGLMRVPEAVQGHHISVELWRAAIEFAEQEGGQPIKSIHGTLAFTNLETYLKTGDIHRTPASRALRRLGYTEVKKMWGGPYEFVWTKP